jgi:hypothetical protein
LAKVGRALVFNAPLEFLQLRQKERESKFSAAQIGMREGGTKVCPRAAFIRLVFEIQASRSTAGLSMRALIKLKPVSDGLVQASAFRPRAGSHIQKRGGYQR